MFKSKNISSFFDGRDFWSDAVKSVANDWVYESETHSENGSFYNLIKDNEKRTIEIQVALAGYNKSEIKVKFSNSILEISTPNGSSYLPKSDDNKVSWRGISGKKRIIKFKISDSTEIDKIKFENGILSISAKSKDEVKKDIELNIE